MRTHGLLGVVGAVLCTLPASSGFAGPVGRVARPRTECLVAMADVPHYALDGSSVGTVAVALRQSSKPMYVVHRKVVHELANRRQGTASTKTRAEVSGGGRKPYKQKGTGRARRGSTRSPLIVGGGVSHGPKPKDWSMKMNKKERRVATASAIMGVLSRAIVVDDLDAQFPQAKTKQMQGLLRALPLDQDAAKAPKVVLVTKDMTQNVLMSGRNIGNLVMLTMNTLNVHDLLGAGKVVLTTSAVEAMHERYGAASDERVVA